MELIPFLPESVSPILADILWVLVSAPIIATMCGLTVLD